MSLANSIRKAWFAQNQGGTAGNQIVYFAPQQVTMYTQEDVTAHTYDSALHKGFVTLSANPTVCKQWFRGTAVTRVDLPMIGAAYVASIADYAFTDCTELTTVKGMGRVTSIGASAFSGCTSLVLTALPSGLTSIGASAFSGCTSVAPTALPSGLTSIGASAFSGCTSLALTALPSGLTSIGASAFSGCTSLAELVFYSTPDSLSADVFADCENLLTLDVPWLEGAVANAPWGAVNAIVVYGLPVGYTKCEYLETVDGQAQYINTGIILKGIDVVQMTAQLISGVSAYCAYFGARKGWFGKNCYAVFCKFGNSSTLCYARTGAETRSSISSFEKLTIVTEGNTLITNKGNIITTGTINDCINNCLLFALNTNSGIGVTPDSPNGTKRCWNFRIKEGSEYLMFFTPALCLAGTTYTDGNTGEQVTASADKPGMYDTVSGRFFVNQGTGADFLYQLK